MCLIGMVLLDVCPANPTYGSDCSLVLDKVSEASSARSGTLADVPGDAWRHRRWGILILCSLFMVQVWIPAGAFAPCQVQRAEFSGVILAIQNLDAVQAGN